MKFSIFQRGVSIYLALVIMFILIAIALGMSLIIVSQMKMIKGMGDSVIAFYAADTGIERALYEKRVNGINWQGSDTVGSASYTVQYSEPPATWKSSGGYQGVKRAIEITHPAVFDFKLTVDPNGICSTGFIVNTTVYADYISGPSGKTVNFSTAPLPPGLISATFNPPSCVLSCSSNLEVKGNTAGSYNIIIYGETDILTKSTTFSFVIGAGECPE